MYLLASGIICLGHLSLPPYMSVIVWLSPETSCEELKGARGPLLKFREVQWPVVKSPFAKSRGSPSCSSRHLLRRSQGLLKFTT